MMVKVGARWLWMVVAIWARGWKMAVERLKWLGLAGWFRRARKREESGERGRLRAAKKATVCTYESS